MADPRPLPQQPQQYGDNGGYPPMSNHPSSQSVSTSGNPFSDRRGAAPPPAPVFGSNNASYSPVDAQNYPAAGNEDLDRAYNNMGGAPEKSSNGRKKWIIGGVVLLLVLIGVGVGVGVAVSHKGSSKSSSTSSSNNGSSTTAGDDWVSSANSVFKYDPNDLSKFETDSRLKKSMYGMAYMPEGAILPSCGATFDQVYEDVVLMSQLTTKIRMYGTDCNQTSLVLDAIQKSKTDLSIYIGIYMNEDETVYARQRDELKTILETYGADHVLGVTVGNEFILNNMTALGLTDATGPQGIAAADYVVSKITEVRTMLNGMSLGKTMPVGNGDAGSYTNTDMLSNVDYFMSNIHPWFGALPIEQSAGWTWEFFEENNVAMAAQVSNNPELYIAEVGWPTQSSDAEHATNGASAASVDNLQIFIDTWICQANTNGTKWFWFENMDQPWKDTTYGGVEGWWGLFDKNKKLKDVTLPDCAPTAS